MFLKNQPGQHIGFCLISVTSGDGLAGLTPQPWVSQDGSHPALPGAGLVKDLGNGQYDYGPTQAETNCNELSVVLTALLAVPQEKTVYPFDLSLPVLGFLSNNLPGGTPFGPRSTLTVNNEDGLILTNPGGTVSYLRLQGAGPTQAGAVSVTPQSFAGEKTFDGGIIVLQPTAGVPSFAIEDVNYSPARFSLVSGNFGLTLDGSFNAQDGTFTGWSLQNGIFRIDYLDATPTRQRASYAVTDPATGTPLIGDWQVDTSGNTFAGGILLSIGSGPAWSSIHGTPTTLAGYGIGSPLNLAQGGTQADLSAAIAGVVVTPGGGGAMFVSQFLDPGRGGLAANPEGLGPQFVAWDDTLGSYFTSTINPAWTLPSILAWDSTGAAYGALQLSGGLSADFTTNTLTVGPLPWSLTNGGTGANLSASPRGFVFNTNAGGPFEVLQQGQGFAVSGTSIATTALATYAVGVAGNWNGSPPTNVKAALDRLAAWIHANFPLLTPP